MGPTEVRATEIGAAEVGATEDRVGEVRPAEVRVGEIYFTEQGGMVGLCHRTPAVRQPYELIADRGRRTKASGSAGSRPPRRG